MAHLTRSFGSIDLRSRKHDSMTFVERRPVPVTITRLYIKSQNRSSDINNNQARILLHPDNPVAAAATSSKMSQFELPLVSSSFALTQVFLYFMAERLLGVKSETDVCVSWQKVIENGELWRLVAAQFFHFGKVHIFFNVVTLMAMGRFLEKKIQPEALVLIICFMSIMSNLFYIFLNDILCSGPNTDYTVGFSTVMFSLRMVHIFTMDSEANNGKGDPNLIFGFLPVHLPTFISPWQPVLETIFFDVVIIGRCVANNVSGMCAGLFFPFLMKRYRHYIIFPKNPPPPPPRFRPRQNNDDNNNFRDYFD